MKIWLNGKIVDEKKATTSVLSHALHYGTGAFEGIRYYKGDRHSYIFRLQDHLKRLQYSANEIGIRLPWSLKTLEKESIRTIKANKHAEGYVRPLVWLGKSKLTLLLKDAEVNGTIIVLPWKKYLGKKVYTLKTSKRKRFDHSAFNPHAKLSGPYINSICALVEARKAGADETLMLDQGGYVAEGSGENIFLVTKGKLVTPKTTNILPGITRDTVFRIAKDLKIPVQEKNIRLQECYTADEMFLTGTAAEITPVDKLDGKKINGGAIGDITYAIDEVYNAIIRGKVSKYKKWLTKI